MQITYPRYVNGVCRPDLLPRFHYITTAGDRTKQPIFIHWNGYNHYNAVVPAEWPGLKQRVSLLPPRGLPAQRPNNMMGGKADRGLSNAEVPKAKPSVSPKRNIAEKPRWNASASPKRNVAASPRRVLAPVAAVKNINAAELIPKP